MGLDSSAFQLESEVPEWARVPRIQGRVLVSGQIHDHGFDSRPVMSPCTLRRADGSLFQPELGTTPNISAEQFTEAVEAASRAWDKGRGEWSTARMEDRISAVARFKAEMLKRRDLVCRLLMWEIAKSWPDAQAEFDRTITYIDDTLEAVKQLDRDCSRIQFAGGIMAQIRRAPLGVTLCLGPFNYPLNETFTTLIPALVMGNVVVVKVPRFGQLIWDALLEPFRDCFPPGVVNIVNGLGRNIIAPSVQSGKVDVLAFIGSSPVANRIKLSHPEPHHFRSVLGLDAKNPAVILPDANLDLAVSECVKGALSFNGQRCTALKILFVHRSISKEFQRRFAASVDSLKYGLPWQPGVSITPLAEPKKAEQLRGLIDEAVGRGARLCNPDMGGKVAAQLMFPAVVADVPLDSRLALEEQFGPVVPIVEYDELSEFEDYVVNSHYGMQLSIFGTGPAQVGELIDRMFNQVCRINLNTQCQRGPDVFPFTGRKRSAEGTLSVTDALRAFSIRSMVAARQDEAGKRLVREILHVDASRFLSTNITL